jgi:hypothetical protein
MFLKRFFEIEPRFDLLALGDSIFLVQHKLGLIPACPYYKKNN